MRDLQAVTRYAVDFLSIRGEDVILSSFPRSGSTWLRFLLCNVISLSEWGGREVDFALLDSTLAELGKGRLYRQLRPRTLPRIVKTHLEYVPLAFSGSHSLGLIRDPRDVMVSYYHFRKDRRASYSGTFSAFIRDPRFGLERWCRHYASWREHWTLTLRYEDLRADASGQLARILGFLGARQPEDVVQEAVRRSSFERIRALEATSHSEAGKQALFARDGRSRQWTTYFSEADVRYCSELLVRYGVRPYAASEVAPAPGKREPDRAG